MPSYLCIWQQFIIYAIIFVVDSADCHLHGRHRTNAVLINNKITIAVETKLCEESAQEEHLLKTVRNASMDYCTLISQRLDNPNAHTRD